MTHKNNLHIEGKKINKNSQFFMFTLYSGDAFIATYSYMDIYQATQGFTTFYEDTNTYI